MIYKSATGQPSQYFVQRFIDHILITLYLTPGSSENGNAINFYYALQLLFCSILYSNNGTQVSDVYW
jgi:hypothetical protein